MRETKNYIMLMKSRVTHCGQRAEHPPHSEAGFTLLEMLVVIAIIGLLIGLIAPAALRQLASARTSVAKQSIERLGSVLDIYKLDNGSYPTTEQGLKALVEKPQGVDTWSGPYVNDAKLPIDAWNHPYTYHSPSTKADNGYDLCSPGPNNAATDAQADGAICNQ